MRDSTQGIAQIELAVRMCRQRKRATRMQAVADAFALNGGGIHLTGLHSQVQNFFAVIQCLLLIRIVIERATAFGACGIGHQGGAGCGVGIISARKRLCD